MYVIAPYVNDEGGSYHVENWRGMFPITGTGNSYYHRPVVFENGELPKLPAMERYSRSMTLSLNNPDEYIEYFTVRMMPDHGTLVSVYATLHTDGGATREIKCFEIGAIGTYASTNDVPPNWRRKPCDFEYYWSHTASHDGKKIPIAYDYVSGETCFIIKTGLNIECVWAPRTVDNLIQDVEISYKILRTNGYSADYLHDKFFTLSDELESVKTELESLRKRVNDVAISSNSKFVVR